MPSRSKSPTVICTLFRLIAVRDDRLPYGMKYARQAPGDNHVVTEDLMRTVSAAIAVAVAFSLAAQERLDVTLIIGGDVELGMIGRGMTDQIARNHALAIQRLLGSDGRRLRWPAGTFGAGTEIAKPAGIFIAGDLAADNSIRDGSATQRLLRELYTGPNAVVQAPAYLGQGNHDIYAHSWWFTWGGQENNRATAYMARETQQDVVSSFMRTYEGFAPPHYAVRKSRLLIVHLNTSLGEPCREVAPIVTPVLGQVFGVGSYFEPDTARCNAQEWLRGVLAAHRRDFGAGAPVIMVQHYGYDDFGLGPGGYRGYWWHPDARDAFAAIINGTNVIAFFHGHTHVAGFTPKGTTRSGQPVFRGETRSRVIDVGYSEGRAWTNVDADRYADYCRVIDANGADGRVRCTRLTAAGFDENEITSGKLDAGYWEGRAWTDVDGDKKADYCRVTGSTNYGEQTIRCTLSQGTSFGQEITAKLDVGFKSGRFWADFNGDGLSDYCRVIGSETGQGKVRCALSTGSGFSTEIESPPLDVGFSQGRGFADVNGDRKADYCRVIDANVGSGKVRCTLSAGDRFGSDIEATLDVGFWEGRAWPDANGDGMADFCRVVGANQQIGSVSCRLSRGDSFGDEITSPSEEVFKGGIDVGFKEGRAWADFNADGKADYCRIVLDSRAECTLWPELRPDASVRSLPLDAGFYEGRAFVDANGDQRADYCRVIDANSGRGRIACTFGAQATTTVPVDSYSVASGYCVNAYNWSTGFTVVRVTDDRLDIVPVLKPQPQCGTAGYNGSVSVDNSLVRSVAIVTH
jgi:hypothetical protein